MTGSFQVNKGKYYAVLNLKDESGKPKPKWINLNIEVDPKNKSKSDKAAEKAFYKVLAEYEAKHIDIYRKDIPFCDYVKVWLEDAKPGLELISYEAYKSYIDLHIFPHFNKLGVSLQDLNYRHIQRYYAAKGETLSANTLKKHHAVINQTLRKALRHNLIPGNPANDVTLPKVEKFTGSYLTVEQGNTLLDVVKDKPLEPVVILGMMYGLRRSEIAGLKWGAINFDNDTLTVQHTVTKFKTTVAKDSTKNKSSNRTLPLNRSVKDYLLRLCNQQAKDKQLLGKAYQDTEYVCRWPDGRVMNCDYLSRGFKRLLKKNDLPEVRLHDLRHSCASYMLKMGCSMKEIADWLGHADIKTAMNVYAHLDFEAKKDVADRFADLLSV